MEIDPDFWLASRLARGTRAERVLNYAALPVIVSAMLALRRIVPDPYAPWSVVEPGQLIAFALFAPILIPFRLAEYDRRGLLDLTRLGGRNPRRILAGLVGGLVAPIAWFVPVLFVFRFWIDRSHRELLGAALVAAATLEIELIVFGLCRYPVREFALAGAAVVGAGIAMALTFLPVGVNGLPRGIELMMLFAIVLVAPVAVSRASGALSRPLPARASNRTGRRPIWFGFVLSGPPELLRRMSATVKPAVVCAAIGATALVAVKLASVAQPASLPPGAFGFDGFLIVAMSILICAAVLVSVITNEVTTGAVDLVRLTPQTSETVAIGWYAGGVGPFALASAALAALAALLIPDARVSASGGAFGATIVSAIFFAEAMSFSLNGGMASRYVPTALAAALGLAPGTPLAVPSPWHVRPAFLVVPIVIVITIAVTAGRLKRPHGPALGGFAALASLAGVAVLSRYIPASTYSRVAVVTACAFATWASVEQRVPSAPTSRVAVAAIGSAIGVALITADLGSGSVAALIAGAAAFLAAAIGLLSFELLHRFWYLAAGVPIVLAVWILRAQARIAPLQSRDVAILAAAAAIVAAVHTGVRWSAHRAVAHRD